MKSVARALNSGFHLLSLPLGMMAILAAAPVARSAATDTIIFDSFNQLYGQGAGQNDLAARKGLRDYGKGLQYKEGGFWYAYKDAGSTVQDSLKRDMTKTDSFDGAEAYGALHASIKTSVSTATDVYAALENVFVGTSTYYNFTNLSAVVVRLKGTLTGTGDFRLNFLTGDVDTSKDWGNYGYSFKTLSSTYSTVTITAANLTPTQYSGTAKANSTWAANGCKNVRGLQFKVTNGSDVDVYIDNIAFVGLDSTLFGLVSTGIRTSAAKSDPLYVTRSGDVARVSYTLAEATRVQAQIVDAKGRVISSVDRLQGAGAQELQLQAPAGEIDFLRLKTGNSVRTEILPIR